MYLDFISSDFFAKWNFEFEKRHKFDPEDTSLPWFMLEGSDMYNADDWLEFDSEPFLTTFLLAHEKSENISLELSGGAYDKLLNSRTSIRGLGLSHYRIQQVTLRKHKDLSLTYVEAIHWLLKRRESNAYGDGYISHFFKSDLHGDRSGDGDAIFFAELRMFEESKVSLRLSLVTDRTDYYAHGAPLPDSLRKDWLEEFKYIKGCVYEECPSRVRRAKNIVDTHQEAAEKLIVWLKRNVHTLPSSHAKLFSADLGFLTSVMATKHDGRRSNRNMYAWYKVLKMFRRYARLETVATPVDFNMATVFRDPPVKRKRETFGPFDLQCKDEWQVFLEAVSMLFHGTVCDSLSTHLELEPLEVPDAGLARGLRFLHATAEKIFVDDDEGGTIRFSLDDRFIQLLSSDALAAKAELRHFFQYLDHHRITPRWCYETISKERRDKGPPFQPQDDIAECLKKAMEDNKMNEWAS